jgi:hypothetical protein
MLDIIDDVSEGTLRALHKEKLRVAKAYNKR